MAESHIDLAEGELISDFEFILPWDVIETCCSLKPQGTSCFVSLNKQAETSNQLFVSKLEDNSIKIRIRVVNIDGDKNKEIGNQTDPTDKKNTSIQKSTENVEAQDGPSVPDQSEFSKEKEKKVEATEASMAENVELESSMSEILDKMIAEEQNSLGLDERLSANKSNFSEGLSTVIIVKKVSSSSAPVGSHAAPESEATHKCSKPGKGSENQLNVNKENLTEEKVLSEESGFTTVKSKVEEKTATGVSATVAGEDSAVTCELCFQQYESYSHLVRHVRKQHRDCTFVRNYLEEIRPLTITPCPICKRNFTAKSSLDAHLKVSHSGQFVRVKNLPASVRNAPIHSKLEANKSPSSEVKKRVTYASRSKGAAARPPADVQSAVERTESESDEDSDSSLEVVNGKHRVKCDVCNESFETRQQALKHQDLAHRPQTRHGQREQSVELFSCKYCDKKCKTKEMLLKHCLGTHFKSNNPKKSKRQKGASSPSGEELSEGGDEEYDEGEGDEAVGKNVAKKGGQKSDRRGRGSLKRSASKKSQGKAANLSASSVSSPDHQSHGHSGFVCDLCGMEFNRMTLLVTHARYCRKSANPK